MKIPAFDLTEIENSELAEFLDYVRIALQGNLVFGTIADGNRGENIQGQFQVVADTGLINTEFTLAHGLNRIPSGFIVVKIDKGGQVYDSGTTWTTSNIYLKCSIANAAVTLFLLP